MHFVLFGAAVGLLVGLWLIPSDTYIDQWVAECRGKGGAAVLVYTDKPLTKRINCLDVKRVDMKDNEP